MCAFCSIYPKHHKHDEELVVFVWLCFLNMSILFQERSNQKAWVSWFYGGWSSRLSRWTWPGSCSTSNSSWKRSLPSFVLCHILMTYPFMIDTTYSYKFGCIHSSPKLVQNRRLGFLRGIPSWSPPKNWIIWQGGPFFAFGKHIYSKIIEGEGRFIAWSWVSVVWTSASWCLFVTMFGR